MRRDEGVCGRKSLEERFGKEFGLIEAAKELFERMKRNGNKNGVR
jgi:hypothetical protein